MARAGLEQHPGCISLNGRGVRCETRWKFVDITPDTLPGNLACGPPWMEMSRYLIEIPQDMTKNEGLQISGSGGQTMREFQAQNMKKGYF